MRFSHLKITNGSSSFRKLLINKTCGSKLYLHSERTTSSISNYISDFLNLDFFGWLNKTILVKWKFVHDKTKRKGLAEALPSRPFLIYCFNGSDRLRRLLDLITFHMKYYSNLFQQNYHLVDLSETTVRYCIENYSNFF